MIEKEIIQLDPKAGSDYAQWAVSSVTTGDDYVPPKWRKVENKEPSALSFRLEEVPEGHHVSPVYGIVKNEKPVM